MMRAAPTLFLPPCTHNIALPIIVQAVTQHLKRFPPCCSYAGCSQVYQRTGAPLPVPPNLDCSSAPPARPGDLDLDLDQVRMATSSCLQHDRPLGRYRAASPRVDRVLFSDIAPQGHKWCKA